MSIKELKNIPNISVTPDPKGIRIIGPDGYTLLADKDANGYWSFLEWDSDVPKIAAHFVLRRRAHYELNGR